MAEYFPFDINYKSYSGSFSGSFFGDGSGLTNVKSSNISGSVTSASYAATASFLLGSVTSASYAATASFLLGSVTSASYALTSSYATTALNGGVTKILAGANINLSPVNGLGDVTVTSFGTNLYNTATGSYGSFYDTGSVSATSATAIYSMSLSTTDISNGVFVSASNGDITRVKFTNAGTYNVQFSSQFSNSDNSIQDVVIWVKKNGVDVVDSSGVVGVPPFKAGSNGQAIAGWNYYLNLSANDFIQICWHVEQANVITLETIAAGTSPTHPRTPSTILTANRVDTFLSNTGSFSGSFTGTLTGTASWAANALTASFLLGSVTSASYALTASYVVTAQTASYVLTAQTASYVLQAVSASFATLAQTANTASYVVTAQTASYVPQAISSSFASTSSYITGSIYTSTNPALSASYASTASFVVTAQTASFVTTSQTASYVLNAVSSSYAATASLAPNYVLNSATSSFVTNTQTSSFVQNSQTGSFATTGSNTFIGNQTITGSLTVSSSNATQLLVGASSLFVSSSGNIGIGTATPTNNLHILGAAGVNTTLKISTPNRPTALAINYSDTGHTGYIDFANVFYITRNSATFPFYINASSNVGINTISPTSKLHVQGSGATSATTALRVENTNTSASLVVLDNGFVGINTGSAAYNLDVNGTARVSGVMTFANGLTLTGSLITNGAVDVTGNSIFRGQVATTTGFYPSGTGTTLNFYGGTSGTSNSYIFNVYGATNNIASNNFVNISRTYDPTSGTGVYNTLLIAPTVSQSGGANGITRGLYITPTLTAAADFRAIETTSGSVSFNHGSTPLMFISSSGNVGIGTLTPTSKLTVSGSVISNTNGLNRLARYGTALSGSTIGTGVTAQTSVYSQLIPANTFSAGNIFRTYFRFRKLATNGNATYNIIINTSNAVAGATTLATLTANTVHNHIKRDFYIAQGNATTSVGSGVSSNTDDTSNTQTLSVINWAVDQYLIYTVTLNTLDSGYGLGYTIEQVL
jgi:hypothetical protein